MGIHASTLIFSEGVIKGVSLDNWNNTLTESLALPNLCMPICALWRKGLLRVWQRLVGSDPHNFVSFNLQNWLLQRLRNLRNN